MQRFRSLLLPLYAHADGRAQARAELAGRTHDRELLLLEAWGATVEELFDNTLAAGQGSVVVRFFPKQLCL